MELNSTIVSLGLLGMLCWQHWHYSRQIQKLIDKVMSRNYAEYQAVTNPPPPEPPRINLNDDPQEDLRVLG